jgi:acyl-CoA synthetase (AMP-forming)/AMP-acid ligase II
VSDLSLTQVIAQRAAARPDAAYLVSADGRRTLSFGQFLGATRRVAAALDELGLTEPAHVAILVADPIDSAQCFLGTIAAGCWAVPLDPTAPDEAIRAMLEGSTIRCGAVLGDRARPLGVDLPWLEAAAVLSRDDGRDATRAGGGVLLSSSGTTGTPKVMALTERHLTGTATLVAGHLSLGPSERGFCPLPLWHVNAQVVGLLATLVGDASLVLDFGFHRTDFWSILDDREATWINAVPAIVARLAVLRDGEAIPSRVRLLRSASAPLSPALQQRFEAATGIPVVESYGMTEAASQICANPVAGLRKPGSVGPPIGVELRIVDDGADEAGHHGHPIGHVEIRGETVITSYEGVGYEDRFTEDGWLRTGDLGYADDDGYVHLVGRSDDVINRGGEKIFPREIEEVILQVEGVANAVVVGMPDDVYGQVPVAYVRFEEADLVDDAERVAAACKVVATELEAALPRVRRPARLHVVESMPAHSVGKVSTSKLRQTTIDTLHTHELA